MRVERDEGGTNGEDISVRYRGIIRGILRVEHLLHYLTVGDRQNKMREKSAKSNDSTVSIIYIYA